MWFINTLLIAAISGCLLRYFTDKSENGISRIADIIGFSIFLSLLIGTSIFS